MGTAGTADTANPARIDTPSRAGARARLRGWAMSPEHRPADRCASLWVWARTHGPGDPRGEVEETAAALLHADAEIRICAVWSLLGVRGSHDRIGRRRRRRDGARAHILGLASHDPAPRVRAAALLTAWALGDSTLSPALARGRSDRSPAVRYLAGALEQAVRAGWKAESGLVSVRARHNSHRAAERWVWSRLTVRDTHGTRRKLHLPLPQLPADARAVAPGRHADPGLPPLVPDAPLAVDRASVTETNVLIDGTFIIMSSDN